MDFASLREEYMLHTLDESDVDPDPFRQFHLWFGEAIRSGLKEPSAMSLATATPDGIPSVRAVLLKGVDESGFVFFTNYQSQKGIELDANPNAALLFLWPELERQVRITGTVTKISRAETEAYFATRPLGSQLGALVSRQSQLVPDRPTLERELLRLQQHYAGREIPAPEYWGGYRVSPHAIEFWQGRRNRLHDRVRYRLQDATWIRERLAP